MSNFKKFDIEQALVTLDQLSQTVEVMDSVINRLKRQLNQQKCQQKNQLPGIKNKKQNQPGYVTKQEREQDAIPAERVLH